MKKREQEQADREFAQRFAKELQQDFDRIELPEQLEKVRMLKKFREASIDALMAKDLPFSFSRRRAVSAVGLCAAAFLIVIGLSRSLPLINQNNNFSGTAMSSSTAMRDISSSMGQLAAISEDAAPQEEEGIYWNGGVSSSAASSMAVSEQEDYSGLLEAMQQVARWKQENMPETASNGAGNSSVPFDSPVSPPPQGGSGFSPGGAFDASGTESPSGEDRTMLQSPMPPRKEDSSGQLPETAAVEPPVNSSGAASSRETEEAAPEEPEAPEEAPASYEANPPTGGFGKLFESNGQVSVTLSYQESALLVQDPQTLQEVSRLEGDYLQQVDEIHLFGSELLLLDFSFLEEQEQSCVQMYWYSLENPQQPREIKQISQSGYYLAGQLCGGTYYLVSRQYLFTDVTEAETAELSRLVPIVYDSAEMADQTPLPAASIVLLSRPRSENFLVVSAVTVDEQCSASFSAYFGREGDVTLFEGGLYLLPYEEEEEVVLVQFGQEWQEVTYIQAEE